MIERIKKEDRGIYVCVADNQVGDGDRRPVKVQVECKLLLKYFSIFCFVILRVPFNNLSDKVE